MYSFPETEVRKLGMQFPKVDVIISPTNRDICQDIPPDGPLLYFITSRLTGRIRR